MKLLVITPPTQWPNWQALEKGLYELALPSLLEAGSGGGEILAARGAGGQDDGGGSDDGYEEPPERNDLPGSLRPQPITQKQMMQAQQECGFCRSMICDLEQEAGGSGKDHISRYWAVFDGVLHRATEAGDARKGYDPARPFVPRDVAAHGSS